MILIYIDQIYTNEKNRGRCLSSFVTRFLTRITKLKFKGIRINQYTLHNQLSDSTSICTAKVWIQSVPWLQPKDYVDSPILQDSWNFRDLISNFNKQKSSQPHYYTYWNEYDSEAISAGFSQVNPFRAIWLKWPFWFFKKEGKPSIEI